MAGDEVKVRVALGTKEAMASIREVEKAGSESAARMGQGMRGRLSAGLRGVGAGAAVGAAAAAGFGMAKRVSTSGLGDLVSELTAGIRADADRVLMGPEVRAQKESRQQAAAALGEWVGRTNDMATARQYQEHQLMTLRPKHLGASRIESELAAGGEPMELLETAGKNVVTAIENGFRSIIDALGGGR